MPEHFMMKKKHGISEHHEKPKHQKMRGHFFFKYVLPCQLVGLVAAHLYFVSKYAAAKEHKKVNQESVPPTSIPVVFKEPAKQNAIATIPFNYPMYKQSDPRWGKDIMVNKTISEVGCLMSSTAMALAGCGIFIGP